MRCALSGTLSELKKRHTDSYSVEFPDNSGAAAFAALLKPENVSVSTNTVTVKHADGGSLIAILAEKKLAPVKFELLEPTLEGLYIEVAG